MTLTTKIQRIIIDQIFLSQRKQCPVQTMKYRREIITKNVELYLYRKQTAIYSFRHPLR